MTKFYTNLLKRKSMLSGIAALAALSVSACSTTQSSPTAYQGAPITYKVDQSAVQNTAVTRPYSRYTAVPQNSNPIVAPQQAAPYQPYQSSQPAPAQEQASRPQTQSQPYGHYPQAQPAPHQTAPQAAPQPVAQPQPEFKSNFDPRAVDTELYAHQRIGKTYTIMGQSYTPKHNPFYDQTGIASWYGDKFHGKLTANGEYYDMDGITAAHKTLPLNSMVYVSNVETGKGMTVRINDRGPFVDGRIIDLSRAVARELGMFNSGLGQVRVQYAGPADPMASNGGNGPILGAPAPSLKAKPGDQSAEYAPYIPQSLNAQPTAKAAPTPTPDYTPLRQLAQPPAQSVALPVPAQPQLSQPQMETPQRKFPFQMNQPQNPLLGHSAPQTAAPQAPLAVEQPLTGEPLGDAPVTLTIKGPVHMATSGKDKAEVEPRFIPAVNYKAVSSGQ